MDDHERVSLRIVFKYSIADCMWPIVINTSFWWCLLEYNNFICAAQSSKMLTLLVIKLNHLLCFLFSFWIKAMQKKIICTRRNYNSAFILWCIYCSHFSMFDVDVTTWLKVLLTMQYTVQHLLLFYVVIEGENTT